MDQKKGMALVEKYAKKIESDINFTAPEDLAYKIRLRLNDLIMDIEMKK